MHHSQAEEGDHVLNRWDRGVRENRAQSRFGVWSTNGLMRFAMPNVWSRAVLRPFVLQADGEPVRETNKRKLETGLKGSKSKVP